MLLKRLHIGKFRGVENKDFEFKKTNIFCGSNGVGKTTCLDAISMLLCGETFTYGKDNTKNRDMNNQQEQCDISLVVETDTTTFNENGDLIKAKVILGCKMYEQYKGKKGEKTEEYIGFKTDWYINERKSTEKEYFNFLKELFNINYNDSIKNFNIFRFLIDYNYTNTCDYKAVKQFIESLLKIAPDIEILKEEKFRSIAYDLSSNNFDIKATNSIYNSKIKELEKSIASTEYVLSDLKSQETIFNENTSILSSIEEKRSKIKDLKETDGLTIEIREEYSALCGAIGEFEFQKNELEGMRNKEYNAVKLKVDEFKEEYGKYSVEKQELEKIINDYTYNLKTLEEEKELYLETISKIDKETVPYVYCPECGCELNKEQIEEFKNNKNSRIAEYSRKIAEINESIVEKENQKKQLDKDLEKTSNVLQKLFEKNQVLAEKEQTQYLKINQKYLDLLNKLEKNTQNQIERYNELTSYIEQAKETKYSTIEDLTKEITEMQSKVEQANFTKERINNYKTELEKLLDNKCLIESKQISLNEFKDYKTQLIKENAHKIFGDIVWVLQEESKANADSKKDKCYATLNGVSMDGVNTASKLVLGSQIINCVKTHLGVNGIPLVFDIVDNIGQKALTKVANIDENQIFCTKANFEEGMPLNLKNLELEKE